MPKLNQIVAIEKGTKSGAQKKITHLHREVQKQPLLAGISRNYRSKDDEGEVFPSESTQVQIRAKEMIDEFSETMTDLFDVVATKDWGNTKARGDIEIDGKTLLKDVPITYLLFLETKLQDIRTFVEKLPYLDPSESWHFDPATNCYANQSVQTVKTKKLPRNHVKFEGNSKHPPQVEVFMEDIVVGYWNTTKFSGALPAQEIKEFLSRIEKLLKAVKFAREQANGMEVKRREVGKKVFDYLFK